MQCNFAQSRNTSNYTALPRNTSNYKLLALRGIQEQQTQAGASTLDYTRLVKPCYSTAQHRPRLEHLHCGGDAERLTRVLDHLHDQHTVCVWSRDLVV